MSMFGTIMSKIFGEGHPAAQGSGAATPHADSTTPPPSTGTADATAGKANTWQDSPANQAGTPPTVDISSMLDGRAAKAGQKLDWRHSIVDLLKLLDMDSSLSARQTLADEMHYTGDKTDSAAMNMWLHKEVMQKITQNGGKLTA